MIVMIIQNAAMEGGIIKVELYCTQRSRQRWENKDIVILNPDRKENENLKNAA